LYFFAAYVPGAPTGVTAIAGDGQAAVSWSAPVSDGGSTITGYTVTASNGQTCTSSGDPTCTVTGLTNGASYTFTVTATNGPGTGPASDASASVLVGVPGAPTGVTAFPGVHQVVVSWKAPAPNGGPAVTGYTVTASSGQTCSTTGALSCVVTGLASRTAVTFTVTATNEAGTGDSSAPSGVVTTVSVPDAPTAITAHAGDSQATVIWSAPYSDGGAAVTGYTVTASSGQSCSTTGALSCVVTGLANGTAVTFTVTATNDAGTSIPSVPSNTVTPVAGP
jgi:fibronectin type 3 domain-containing protein